MGTGLARGWSGFTLPYGHKSDRCKIPQQFDVKYTIFGDFAV